MDTEVANVVDAILTAILQWRVAWLDEQKQNSQPPPICRTQPRKVKITYDSYKDYESTFVPLLMHEIWAQIFEEWAKLELELNDAVPMDIDDDEVQIIATSSKFGNLVPSNDIKRPHMTRLNSCQRQFHVGVTEYKTEGQFQCMLRCQYLVETHKLAQQLKVIGEGDLVCLDLVVVADQHNYHQQTPNSNDYIIDAERQSSILRLFAYVTDVVSERVSNYTTFADCYKHMKNSLRNHHVITYNLVIAKRPLRLKLSEPMKLSRLYYLKPMIRQIESVAMLRESALASDILSPKIITCQLSIPTVVSINSPYYNDMQYKAIIGANEALVRSIPKIQLIQGPPGTGKTHTLVGIIRHFYINWPNATKVPKILICAPSNGAIDEVARRLYKEREFLKYAPIGRSLRLVRVGHPDQISDSVKSISLEELVETNANVKIDSIKKKHSMHIRELENELARCDTEITNLRFTCRSQLIPEFEAKIAKLLKELESFKASEETIARREISEASKRNMRYELIKNADVILTTLNSCQRHPLDVLFKAERSDLSFHCVIVDEASQCCEPELLMPLCYKITKMILIGDPMQLPATVISRYAQEFDFGRSLFERFFIHFGKYDLSSPIAMLTHQYRMHPEICRFPSMQFYDNRLVTARMSDFSYPLRPYIMFDLKHGVESKSKNSLENENEAALVRNLLTAVLTKAPAGSQIGVITPYRGQKKLITNKVTNLQTERNIKIDVNTCDGFQGQEKDIIILSCVRTFEHNASVGFLKSYQRVNVALTRAKHCLIICISAKSLTKDKTWQALLTDAINRHCVQILEQMPSTALLTKIICNGPESQPYFYAQ